ncbi:MAG: GNAT family N-acetyltransferase [Sphaerochaetaceae bacterium]|nr:GNAT family N-acetyltransferase [Sphaerochaetaceae bacterium]
MHIEPENTMELHISHICSRLSRTARRLHLPPWVFDYSRTLLMEVPVLQVPRGTCTVRPAGIRDLPLLAACRQMDDAEKGIALFTSRINKGSSCYLLFDGGSSLLGYAWVIGTVNLFEDDDRISVSCSYDQAYIFDTFLHPSARGRDLYRMLIAHLQHDMAYMGKQRFYVLVDHRNAGSIKAHQKLGATVSEDIGYTSLFGICRYKMSCKNEFRKSLRRFHSGRPCYSLTLRPRDPRHFTLSVQALNDEKSWQSVTARLDACDLSGSETDTPFNDASIVKEWWEQDIRGKEELFLLEVIDTESSLTAAYGFFRLYTDTKRFGSPRTLSTFNDTYFMHNTLLARTKEVQASDVLQFLSSGKQIHSIREKTSADVIIWHRLPAQQVFPFSPGSLSTRHAFFETSYPVLDGAATSSPLESEIAKHTLRDLNKQSRRLRNRFNQEPQTSCFKLGSLDTQLQDTLLARFFTLFATSWQHQWMSESSSVDLKLFERKLTAYTHLWADRDSVTLYINQVGDIDMSYLFTLQNGQYCWCLLIGYDPQYKSYSPGKKILIDMFCDTWSKGIRTCYLGGNVVGWKSDWMTSEQYLYTLELWLSRPQALMHSLKRLIGNNR